MELANVNIYIYDAHYQGKVLSLDGILVKNVTTNTPINNYILSVTVGFVRCVSLFHVKNYAFRPCLEGKNKNSNQRHIVISQKTRIRQ